MLARTYLFVPADPPDRFGKALASGADRVVIDLEDAVKPEAKAAARAGLSAADLDWSRVVVRVNDAASSWWADDWAAVAALPAAGVLVPKAEDAVLLAEAASGLGRHRGDPADRDRARAGRGRRAADGAGGGAGRLRASRLRCRSRRGAGLGGDALRALDAGPAVAARGAGGADRQRHPGHRRRRGARARDRGARRLGFGAKLLIHPRQVAIARRIFAPSESEVAWARRVVAALEGASGAAKVDGRMIDKPVADAARQVLAAHEETQG